MRNKRLKQRIKNILKENEDLTTGEIMFVLNNVPSIRGHNGKKKILMPNSRHDNPTITQLSMLLRGLAHKNGFCNETKQTRWKLKEENENVMDRKIPAQ